MGEGGLEDGGSGRYFQVAGKGYTENLTCVQGPRDLAGLAQKQ